MEKFNCPKCGKEVYKTSLGRMLEEYSTTLITHSCKKAVKEQPSS